MKIGYWKNTTADIGKGLSFALWSIRLTVNTPGLTNYLNKSQCLTVPSWRLLTMMLITEMRYFTTALTLCLEIMIGITLKSGGFIQRVGVTSNQNQHDQLAEQPASVGMR